MAESREIYPILNGIPSFLSDRDLVGNNRKYQKFYDKVGIFTGSVFWFFCRLFRLDMISKRKELLSNLSVRPTDLVLETSIGAGANIPALEPAARYVGVDISMGMLKACQKYALTKSYDLHLVHANAENLPFEDKSFDVVFHFGGINFFNDPARAIVEMIRVAKPGALILIGDETQQTVDSWYKKIPLIKRYFRDSPPVEIPLKLIPKAMENVVLEYRWDNSMYLIHFNKPV